MIWFQLTQAARNKGNGMRQLGKAGQVVIFVVVTLILSPLKLTRWVLQSIYPMLVKIQKADDISLNILFLADIIQSVLVGNFS